MTTMQARRLANELTRRHGRQVALDNVNRIIDAAAVHCPAHAVTMRKVATAIEVLHAAAGITMYYTVADVEAYVTKGTTMHQVSDFIGICHDNGAGDDVRRFLCDVMHTLMLRSA